MVEHPHTSGPASEKRQLWELFKDILSLTLRSSLGITAAPALAELIRTPRGTDALAAVLHIDREKSDFLAHWKSDLSNPSLVKTLKSKTWQRVMRSAEQLGLTIDERYAELVLTAARLATDLKLPGPAMENHLSYDDVARVLLEAADGDPRMMIARLCDLQKEVAIAFLDQEDAPWPVRASILRVLRCTEGELISCRATLKRGQEYDIEQARSALDRLWQSVASHYIELVGMCGQDDVIAGLDLSFVRDHQRSAHKLWQMNVLRCTIMEKVAASAAGRKRLLLAQHWRGRQGAEGTLEQVYQRAAGGIELVPVDVSTASKLMQAMLNRLNVPAGLVRQADVCAFAKGTCVVLNACDFLVWVRHVGEAPRELLEQHVSPTHRST